MANTDVLVVDDDTATRVGLKELLALAGITVDDAHDGPAALDKMGGNTFKVVLLDVHLPGLDGFEVLARCVEIGTPSKIIVMTGRDTTETVLAAMRGQAYDFIPKPIDAGRLVETIKRALAASPVTPPIEILSARPEWIELLVPCTREAVDRIQSFIQQLDADLADEVRNSIGLAFRELLLNGVEWGGQLDPARQVRVACLRTRRMRLYRIADPGSGFTFEGLSHAAVSNAHNVIAHDKVRDEKGIRPGGFGLVLIRAIADELIYNERQNEVVFIKYLDEADRELHMPAVVSDSTLAGDLPGVETMQNHSSGTKH